MNKRIIFSAIVALFAGLGMLQAQTKAAPSKKYALLVSAEDHIKMATKTARSLFSDSRYDAAAFEVIICGKAAETVKGDPEWIRIFQEGKKLGIVYRVCGISLEKFKIAETTVPAEVQVVPNGILHMFDLKEKGFTSVEL